MCGKQPTTQLAVKILPRQHRGHAVSMPKLRGGEFGVGCSTQGVKPGNQRIQVMANVASIEEAATAISAGADGIGLFRTESLFIGRTNPPSEDEQFAVYAAAVDLSQGRSITFRTFDFCAEKLPSYIELARESNPSLGYRGARIYNQFDGMLRTQLHAMFRAACCGPVSIVVPMIATAEEMREFHAVAADVRKDYPGAQVSIGMILEVPSAIFAMPELSNWAEFFCLSTDHLAQYFFAANHDNARLDQYYQWSHPSFFRLLTTAIDNARASARPIGFSAEITSNEEAQGILLGLGMEILITKAVSIHKAKEQLARLDAAVCQRFADAALLKGDGSEPETLSEHPSRPISPELIVLNSDAQNKFQAIGELIRLLVVAGRSIDTNALEETVWAREEIDASKSCNGVAVIRCRSNYIAESSIVYLRMRSPIKWDSLDNLTTDTVILLAAQDLMPRGEHMQIYACLSRLLTRENFTARLRASTDVSSIISIIKEGLPYVTIEPTSHVSQLL